MSEFILIAAIFCILIGTVILFFVYKDMMHLGILRNKKTYSDTFEKPGEVLYATTLPLCGKPDYIITQKNIKIPVEVKSGKTPRYPYENHIDQHMAYCYLVEEVYGKSPGYEYIRYKEREFKVEYSSSRKKRIVQLVREIQRAKELNRPFLCLNPYHNGH